MMLENITPIIITFNEEANISRVLEPLRWAKRIVIVDSFSSDRTPEIAASFPQVQLVQNRFEHHADQWSFALAQANTEWVLALDADYVVSPEFVEELRRLDPPADIGAWEARFTYWVFGRPLRGTLYTPKPVLLRRSAASFSREGHKERRAVTGGIGQLAAPLAHDDRKPFREFLRNQDHYMSHEARLIRATPFANLPPSGKVRKLIVVAPFAALLFTLFVRGTVLDGWRGVYYAFQRMLAESILSLKLIEQSLTGE